MKSNDYRVVFLGTSEFAQVILKDLIDMGFNVVACITRPDRPSGRNLKMSYSPVKQYCIDKQSHIPLYQPVKVSTADFEEVLRSLNPHLFVVAAFGEIIKSNILNIPKDGSINVHPSILPKYRGPSPLQTALLNGDLETGVCIIDVAQKMDAGEVFACEKFNIDPDENFTSLQAKALNYTKKLLATVIHKKISGDCVGQMQDESQVSFCKKISTEDEKINWDHDLFSIHNKIRALSDKPGAWCYVDIGGDVKRVKIYASSLFQDSQVPFAENSKKHLFIKKEGFVLSIKSLQVEGKKRLTAVEFLAGLKNTLKFF